MEQVCSQEKIPFINLYEVTAALLGDRNAPRITENTHPFLGKKVIPKPLRLLSPYPRVMQLFACVLKYSFSITRIDRLVLPNSLFCSRTWIRFLSHPEFVYLEGRGLTRLPSCGLGRFKGAIVILGSLLLSVMHWPLPVLLVSKRIQSGRQT